MEKDAAPEDKLSSEACVKARARTFSVIMKRKLLDKALGAIDSGLSATRPNPPGKKGRAPADHKHRLIAAKLAVDLHQAYGIIPSSKTVLEWSGEIEHRLSADDREYWKQAGDKWALEKLASMQSKSEKGS